MNRKSQRKQRRREAAFERTARQIRRLATADPKQVPIAARVWGEFR